MGYIKRIPGRLIRGGYHSNGPFELSKHSVRSFSSMRVQEHHLQKWDIWRSMIALRPLKPLQRHFLRRGCAIFEPTPFGVACESGQCWAVSHGARVRQEESESFLKIKGKDWEKCLRKHMKILFGPFFRTLDFWFPRSINLFERKTVSLAQRGFLHPQHCLELCHHIPPPRAGFHRVSPYHPEKLTKCARV